MKDVWQFIIVIFFLSIFLVMSAFSEANSADIYDYTVFVEAFNAYHQKNYLLTIEKCDQLNEVFPDSPLRDVTLLLTARASLKSGDNNRAAKTVSHFLTEFPESGLKASIEDDLKVLVDRNKKGEVLAADISLFTAAVRVRSDRVARELEAENDRMQAEKLAKASIKAVITFQGDQEPIPVGSIGSLPVEISNIGTNSEVFLLSVAATKEYGAILTKADKPGESISSLQLAAGETFKGTVTLKMPAEIVDGHRSVITLKTVSVKFSDVIFQKDYVVVSSAPLMRAVAKLAKQNVTPGEKLSYKVTVINAGSLPAQNLTVRLHLPPEVEYIADADLSIKQEPNGTVVFKINSVETGKLAEIILDVKIREGSAEGQLLRGQVEIINGNLKRKDIFHATPSVVVGVKRQNIS